MSEYRRPQFPVATYLSEQGDVIDYGHRWKDLPPDEAYSRAEEDILDAIRIVPNDSDEAPLTSVLTPFPGVFLHAGSLHDFHFPDCGLDACDEDVEAVATELEWTVRSVVSGGYSERFDPWPAR
ncbi:DUF6226 family protein [Arthrobacter sp. SX1312]|uniref:DUF6226 family protein n=1 Tax=Arthrobacter sp. SX1312 TaxID=2058896 RepID=UPI0011AFDB0A|nr:DUF6226 family protein [Arthrobacter sp. SX1312]